MELNSNLAVVINIADQTLSLFDGDKLCKEYPIASAKNGVGQKNGSECTPLGLHRIRAKIGQGEALGAVFVGRRPTGEIYSEALALDHPGRDWILTRILWLCGNEVGFNRGGDVDTMRRYIYIHGAPDSHPMQIPSSHGCIKMRNTDMLDLFSRVNVGAPVLIKEYNEQ